MRTASQRRGRAGQRPCGSVARWRALLAATALLAGAAGLARACTVVQLLNDGFATNALYLMRAIPIFYRQNGTLYVDNTDFPYSCGQDGGFHDFFKYEEHLADWSAAKEGAAGDACRRVTFGEIDDIIYNTLKVPHYNLDLIGVQRAWWYRKWVWDWIERNRLAALRSVAAPTMAFHIRGGDVFDVDNEQARASTMPPDYVRAFQARYPRVTGGTCLFAGDQQSLLLQASEIAQEALGCTPVFGAAFPLEDGYSRDAFGELDLDERCEATLQLLGDMEMLARADFFVSSFNSRVARIVEWMRYTLYAKDRASVVDASAARADLYAVIGSLFQGRAVQVGQQGGAQSAGELPELTKLEEEEEAAAKAEPKAGGDGEAAKVSAAAAQPKPKGSAKSKGSAKKAAKAHAQVQEEANPDTLQLAAECEGQDCGGAHGGQEGQWDAEDAATADDKEYATGAAGVERAPSGDGSFSGR